MGFDMKYFFILAKQNVLSPSCPCLCQEAQWHCSASQYRCWRWEQPCPTGHCPGSALCSPLGCALGCKGAPHLPASFWGKTGAETLSCKLCLLSTDLKCSCLLLNV